MKKKSEASPTTALTTLGQAPAVLGRVCVTRVGFMHVTKVKRVCLSQHEVKNVRTYIVSIVTIEWRRLSTNQDMLTFLRIMFINHPVSSQNGILATSDTLKLLYTHTHTCTYINLCASIVICADCWCACVHHSLLSGMCYFTKQKYVLSDESKEFLGEYPMNKIFDSCNSTGYPTCYCFTVQLSIQPAQTGSPSTVPTLLW